jgi:cytidine deaminase
LYLCNAKVKNAMKQYEIRTHVNVLEAEEMSAEVRELIEAAKEATKTSYSPYSHFQVGAALRLQDGEIIMGSNQENAAYPVGCCAERTALFWCGANRSGATISAIAIAAQTEGRFTKDPIAPCGMCRQALLEVEHKQGAPIRVLLYGEEGTHCIESVEALMPLTFNAESMDI